MSLDNERQEKAKHYARIERRVFVFSVSLGMVYILAWLIFGWARALEIFLFKFTINNWLLVIAFGAVFGAGLIVLDLPLTYYSGYFLPHQYEMSNQNLLSWILDQIKELAIGMVLGGLVLEIIYAMLRATLTTWWFWAAIILLFFNVVLAILAPVVLFPIFNKFSPLSDEYAELKDRLLLLAQKAQTQIQGVFKFDMSRRTKAANAALAGLGKTRRIILGDTLLSEFTIDEIETVIAHELGHQVHRDILLGIVVQSGLTLGGLYLAALGLEWGTKFFNLGGPENIASLPLFLLVMGLFEFITMPLTNAFSRWRERRADQFSLQTTGKGDAFASAMARLADQNLADADPEAWVEWLFYSHPALRKRIKMAKDWEKQI
jgi:STE24 endopeptidase